MPAGPLIMAGGSLLGGVLGGKGAKKAADAQTKLGEEALQLQKDQYNQSRTDQMPWITAGGNAIGAGAAMLQPGYDYTASPGYQFRLDEGNRAIQNSGAAKGMLMSGGTLKDIDRFSQGLAASDFNDQFNRQMAIAGGGQQAVSSLGQLGSNYANGSSDILNSIGQAKASGYAGQNQAVQGTLGNLMSIYGMSQGYNPFGG